MQGNASASLEIRRARRLWARSGPGYFALTVVLLVCLHLAYGLAHRIYNSASPGDLTFTSDFESGDASLWSAKGAIHVCCNDSLQIVAAPVRSGRYAARFTLRRSDPNVKGSKRAEVRTKAATMGGEYWYAFSIMLPPHWTVDKVPVTLAQWHAVPDLWLGEINSPPPFRLLAEEDQWKLANIWDSKRVGSTWLTRFSPDGYTLKAIGPLDAGRWTDWVFHVRWSYGSDGLLEAWKDSELVFRRIGPNSYNDALAPYLKVGIYVPRWDVHPPLTPIESHTIHFDDIRVSETPITLIEMLPRS
jgi:hypothetical protein